MADNKGYMRVTEEKGSINIAEDVIAAIAVEAAREVEGVSGMLTGLSAVGELKSKAAQRSLRSVKIEMGEEAISLDLSITVAYGHPVLTVAENTQKAVAASVAALTGCKVDRVNIHVGGITLAD